MPEPVPGRLSDRIGDGATPEVGLDRPAGLELESARQGRSGPLLLFLHGLGGTCRSWDPQLIELGPRFRTVAWTMPGYGRSEAPRPFGFPALADRAAALIEHLDAGPAIVIGHSLGGYVGQQLALDHPARVAGLVLAGTTAAFGKPGSDFNRRFLTARAAPLDEGRTPADLAPDIVDGLVGPSTDAAVRQSAIDSMATISAEDYRRALVTLVTWDARDRLPSLEVATLCIAGELDRTAPPRSVSALADLIPGARYAEIADCGHLLNLEAPQPFSRLVSEFSDSVIQP